MDWKKDGGWAFPRTGSDAYRQPQDGMTLRDYYAEKAMAAIVMGGGLAEVVAMRLAPEVIAEQCWAIADAMIATRSR